MTNASFWMVYRHGGHAPQVQHQTRESAEAEAARIARLNPGSEVYVLQATHRFETKLQPCVRTTLSDEMDVEF